MSLAALEVVLVLHTEVTRRCGALDCDSQMGSSSDGHWENAALSLARTCPTNAAQPGLSLGMSHSNMGVQTTLGSLIPGIAGVGAGETCWREDLLPMLGPLIQP